MSSSQWHKFYAADIEAPPGGTTDVDPYPVRLGSRYHEARDR